MVKARAECLPIFLKWLSPIYAEKSALLRAAYPSYSSFRLVRLLRHEQAMGVWGHAPPGKILKLGTLRSLLRPCLG